MAVEQHPVRIPDQQTLLVQYKRQAECSQVFNNVKITFQLREMGQLELLSVLLIRE